MSPRPHGVLTYHALCWGVILLASCDKRDVVVERLDTGSAGAVMADPAPRDATASVEVEDAAMNRAEAGSVVPVCGNGVPEEGEACDEGEQTLTCDFDCQLASCDPACTCRVNDGRRYMVCGEALGWDEARARCEAQGLQLMQLEDASENVWLQDVLTELNYPSVWVGASDTQTDGEWRWLDGTLFYDAATMMPVDGTFSNFPDFEPDVGDCLSVFQSTSWHAEPCETPRGFVCERY